MVLTFLLDTIDQAYLKEAQKAKWDLRGLRRILDFLMIPGVHRGFLHGCGFTIMTSMELNADNQKAGHAATLGNQNGLHL